MFKSIKCIDRPNRYANLLGVSVGERANKINLYEYEITDSDFVEAWASPCYQWLGYPEVRCGAIIACYQNKDNGHFVAYNLALYHLFMQQTYYWYEIDKEFGYNCDHTPWYKDYVDEIKDILSRIDSLKAFW